MPTLNETHPIVCLLAPSRYLPESIGILVGGNEIIEYRFRHAKPGYNPYQCSNSKFGVDCFVRTQIWGLPPQTPNIERAECRPHLHAETLREQTPPAQGSVSGIVALSLMVALS
jgi:hypothetical protein